MKLPFDNDDDPKRILSESGVRIARLLKIVFLVLLPPFSFLLLYVTAASFFFLTPVTGLIFSLFLYLLIGYYKISKREAPPGGNRTVWACSFLFHSSVFCLTSFITLSLSYESFRFVAATPDSSNLPFIGTAFILICWGLKSLFFLAAYLSAKAF